MDEELGPVENFREVLQCCSECQHWGEPVYHEGLPRPYAYHCRRPNGPQWQWDDPYSPDCHVCDGWELKSEDDDG